jgi:hypothetical protein
MKTHIGERGKGTDPICRQGMGRAWSNMQTTDLVTFQQLAPEHRCTKCNRREPILARMAKSH